METIKTLVHAFVTSKLDNCNALLYGLRKYKIQRLQYALNSAARQVTLSRKHDHISPVLMGLHILVASWAARRILGKHAASEDTIL